MRAIRMLHVVRLCPHISAVCINDVTERHSSIQLTTTAASIYKSKIPLLCWWMGSHVERMEIMKVHSVLGTSDRLPKAAQHCTCSIAAEWVGIILL